MRPSNRLKVRLGFVGLMAAGLTLGITTPALADYAPQSGDIVGVGGDTAQFALEFGADGDYNGDAGFNTSNPINRLVTFNATADGNGRSAYGQGSTENNPVPLDPTDVLRAGTFPVQRISSSGAALNAIDADTQTPETINFIWSSSLPSPTQQILAGDNHWGYLHVVEIGTDTVQIAAALTTNAPSTGLSIQDLLDIYTGADTTWNELPGNSGGSSATIVPLIPPTSSSIYKTFIADLTTANGGTAPTLAANVATVEQNDPTAIAPENSSGVTQTGNPNAIVPFSAARLALWNDGYFHNPVDAFPGGSTALSPGIKLESGTGDYSSQIIDYVIFRQTDTASTTPMEPGSSLNWVQTLFSNPGGRLPFFDSAAGQALIASSGVTPDYVDLGDVES